MKGLTTIALCFLTVFSFGQENLLIDKVIAYIGSELVLLSEVEEQYTLMKEQNPGITGEMKCGILENVMIQKLLVNQAALDSVVVADEEVNLQLDARIDRILAMMNNDVAQFEAYYNKGIAEVKEQFRTDLRNQILAERMQQTATADIKVTPSEVKSFFESIPKDSLPYFGSEVEIAEITVMPEVNDAEKSKAVERLNGLKERIDAGEDFGELAQKFSDDPGSALAGGELGWMKRGSLVPEYEAAAYNLETNEVSDIVESEFGLHLIQLLGRRGNSIHTRHILIKPEITLDDLDRTKIYMDSIRGELVKDSISFISAVALHSNKKAQSYNNGGRLTNPATGNTFFEVGELEPDIFFTIDSMDVGSVSSPVQYTTPRGETAFRMVKLLSRTQPHQANLKEDYFKIQKAAIEQKKNIAFIEWVKGKVEGTYVTITSEYETCPNMALWLED